MTFEREAFRFRFLFKSGNTVILFRRRDFLLSHRNCWRFKYVSL